jgi:hypothetical protein
MLHHHLENLIRLIIITRPRNAPNRSLAHHLNDNPQSLSRRLVVRGVRNLLLGDKVLDLLLVVRAGESGGRAAADGARGLRGDEVLVVRVGGGDVLRAWRAGEVEGELGGGFVLVVVVIVIRVEDGVHGHVAVEVAEYGAGT